MDETPSLSLFWVFCCRDEGEDSVVAEGDVEDEEAFDIGDFVFIFSVDFVNPLLLLVFSKVFEDDGEGTITVVGGDCESKDGGRNRDDGNAFVVVSCCFDSSNNLIQAGKRRGFEITAWSATAFVGST